MHLFCAVCFVFFNKYQSKIWKNLYIVTAGKILESLCTADILVLADITG